MPSEWTWCSAETHPSSPSLTSASSFRLLSALQIGCFVSSGACDQWKPPLCAGDLKNSHKLTPETEQAKLLGYFELYCNCQASSFCAASLTAAGMRALAS